ncbi:MAG: hypothetical protein Q7R47_03145 [Candidatus Diapherotrites archaeon]|nr:hypothetical protein [Candidatus Diapherotrites archaeon]
MARHIAAGRNRRGQHPPDRKSPRRLIRAHHALKRRLIARDMAPAGEQTRREHFINISLQLFAADPLHIALTRKIDWLTRIPARAPRGQLTRLARAHTEMLERKMTEGQYKLYCQLLEVQSQTGTPPYLRYKHNQARRQKSNPKK